MKKYIPDALAISGLSSLGYGLYLFDPWLSYSTVGAILILFSVVIGRNNS